MRINQPYNFGPHRVSGEKGSSQKAAASDKSGSAKGVEVVMAETAEYIAKAMETEDIDAQAVQEARELLESGTLDTPEAALRAAGSILNFEA
ncbi:MAG: hypothetical protein ACLFVU_14950 [Phycisphaerae bacterium]